MSLAPEYSEEARSSWTLKDSETLYQVRGWGYPYFSVGERGNVWVTPDPETPDLGVDLFELTQDLIARGLEPPILIRFSDILAHRIKRINTCFARAISEYKYQNEYRGVYPVKVNQQRHVVQEVVEFGRAYHYGLEVGSKPELLIALSEMKDTDGLIICNGYKDRSYIETALIAQRFEKTVVVVLERAEELDYALDAAKRLGIRPMLGVRAKLSSKGMGRWGNSAGEKAKFGLSVAEIVTLVDRLAELDMLDTLRLLHFHIGSQISSIIPIKNALQEASNIYVELAKMGCRIWMWAVAWPSTTTDPKLTFMRHATTRWMSMRRTLSPRSRMRVKKEA
jgi:arginine decarboxylase